MHCNDEVSMMKRVISNSTDLLRPSFDALDEVIRGWWSTDVVDADDPRRAAVESIALPFPYVAGAAPTSPDWYTTMFNWDAYFSNLALLVHGRPELVRNAIENYLFMVKRFGYMPNGNEVALATRSQIPLFPDSIWRYVQLTGDDELLARAYPLLVREYTEYWLAPHHATPTGLVTNRDLGDPTLDPRLSAEAETGLDWTTQYDGDITQTNPVLTNCALVVYAETLGAMADRLGLSPSIRESYLEQAAARAALIRQYCWSEERGQYLDYNFVTGTHVSVLGATSYWALWAGVATDEQAAAMVDALPQLLEPHGLSTTEASRPDPELFALPYEDLQWTYPAGWPPLHIMACWGLDRYGFADESREIASRIVSTISRNYDETGQLYEKYNVVDGSLVLPNSRYGTITLHGWTSATVVLLGRRLFDDSTIDETLAAVRLP